MPLLSLEMLMTHGWAQVNSFPWRNEHTCYVIACRFCVWCEQQGYCEPTLWSRWCILINWSQKREECKHTSSIDLCFKLPSALWIFFSFVKKILSSVLSHEISGSFYSFVCFSQFIVLKEPAFLLWASCSSPSQSPTAFLQYAPKDPSYYLSLLTSARGLRSCITAIRRSKRWFKKLI